MAPATMPTAMNGATGAMLQANEAERPWRRRSFVMRFKPAPAMRRMVSRFIERPR